MPYMWLKCSSITKNSFFALHGHGRKQKRFPHAETFFVFPYLCYMPLNKFLTYLAAERRYSPHTIEAYARDIGQFVEFSGFRGDILSGFVSADGELFDPAAVTTDDIRGWIGELSEKEKLGAASINRKASSLRALFRFLRKTNVVSADPFLGIGSRKAPKRLPGFVPESTMDDVVAGLETEFASDDYTKRRNALLILLFYTTGLRLAELHAVRLGDFSNGYSELRVLGKGGKERVVPIIDCTRRKIVGFMDDLKALDVCISPELSLFLTDNGDPVSRSVIYRVVREELERAGVQGKRSPHVLRHTFATHMMDGGADIREIQEILGHSSLATTQVYTHNSIAKLKEVYAKAHPRVRKDREEK